MGAVLAILANPVISKLIGKITGAIFNRSKKNGDVKDKVSAPATALLTISAIIAGVSAFDPGFGAVLQEHLTPQLVAAIAAAVVAIVGYFKPESVA